MPSVIHQDSVVFITQQKLIYSVSQGTGWKDGHKSPLVLDPLIYLGMLPFPCTKYPAREENDYYPFWNNSQTFFPSSLPMSRLDRREDIGLSVILSQLSPLTLDHLPFIFSDSIRKTCQWGKCGHL